MAVRRVFVPDPDPFPGDPPGWYRATGTDSSETYVTQEGDLYVYMKGGADTVYIRETYLEAGFSSIFVSGGSGNDRLLDRHGGSGKGIDGDGGNDYIEVRSGDDGSSADGGTGNDVLKSLGGESVALHGGLGDDKLYASADDIAEPVLNGGGGKDRLFCNTAQDTLQFFTNHSGTGATRDVVFRFDEDDDRIDLAGMDAHRSIGGNQEFGWDGEVGRPSEVGVGRIGYFQSGNDLVIAGNSGIRFEIELDGLAGHALNADDFWL